MAFRHAASGQQCIDREANVAAAPFFDALRTVAALP
jgi:hypothetical protein